jgi:tetratricopeptide (TPR) repeat protein
MCENVMNDNARQGTIIRGHAKLAVVAFLSVMIGGCATRTRTHYRTVADRPQQDSLTAQRLNTEGLRSIEGEDLEAAERKFREALEHDLYYAPAHNNLGLVLTQTQRYYEAAWEFDYAAKLAPRAVEPRQNLALLYENLGRLDEAISGYEGALEIDSKNAVAMRHLARAYVKAGRKDHQLGGLLDKLAHIPGDQQWDRWIRGQIIRMGRDSEPSSRPFRLDSAD